jgi:hypothetical protein
MIKTILDAFQEQKVNTKPDLKASLEAHESGPCGLGITRRLDS